MGNDEGDSNVATGIAGDDPDLDAEAVENACVNQTGWDTDFSNRMYTCAIKNGGNAKKGGKCMSETQGVSGDCGRCLGRLMKCSRPCARKCCSGKCMEKPKCKKCVSSRCASSFKNCAGVDAPQLRGEMKSTAASQESPANDPAAKNHDENDDENADENHDENDDENDEGDSNVATGIAGDDPDLDAEAVENACVNQTGWDTDFSNRMYTCAIKNGGNAKTGGKCMSETQGVSRDCGRCLGRLMKCSRGSRPCA